PATNASDRPIANRAVHAPITSTSRPENPGPAGAGRTVTLNGADAFHPPASASSFRSSVAGSVPAAAATSNSASSLSAGTTTSAPVSPPGAPSSLSVTGAEK